MGQLRRLILSDKQTKRMIDILEVLAENDAKYSLWELCQKVGCTRPTGRESIELLNYQFFNHLSISIGQKSDIEFHTTASISMLVNELIKGSVEFQIVDGIFRGIYKNFNHAQETIGLSKSTMMYKIDGINEVLALFDVKITTRYFGFTGKETDIRLFLFNFYLEFGDLKVVSDTFQSDVIKFMKFADTVDKTMRFSQARIGIWIPILLMRWRGRNFISDAENQVDDLIPDEEFCLFEAVFKKTYGRHIPDEEIKWFYVTALYCISYSDPIDLMRTTYTIWRHEKIHQKVISLFQKIYDISEDFIIDTGGGSKKGYIYAYLNNMVYLKRISRHFDYVPWELKQHINETHGALLGYIEKKLYSVKKCDTLKVIATKNIAVSLTAFQVSFDYTRSDEKPHLLFSFVVEAGFEHYIVKQSKLAINENVTYAHYMDDRIIDNFILKFENPDIIICNHDTYANISPRTRLVRLNTFPTENDWQNVKSEVNRLLLLK